jgi:hypothetical protein
MKRLVLTCAALAAFGCGQAPTEGDPIRFDKVPPAARDAAVRALPGMTIEGAWKDGETYEIRGKSEEGEPRIVRVSADGKVLEVD